MQVHFETYREVEPFVTKDGKSYPRFSVEVTIGKDRRAVSASSLSNGHIMVYGLAIRFSSGSKVWPGSAVYWVESGNVNNMRPNIDKRGYFSLVGYSADFEGREVRSQHNAVA
jgi:hypothetical protein